MPNTVHSQNPALFEEFDGQTTGPSKLSLEDFAATDFSAEAWFNRNIDDISHLSTDLQVLCQSEAEAADEMASSLQDQLPSAMFLLQKLVSEVEGGQGHIEGVMKEINRERNKETFGYLTDMARTKERIEVAKAALRELQTWDKRIRDVDEMLRNGNLTGVIDHLSGLKDVCECLGNLPDYDQHQESIRNFENDLHTLTRRKVIVSLENENAEDLRNCCEVCIRCEKKDVLNSLVNDHFTSLTTKFVSTIQQQESNANASSIGESIRHFFDGLYRVSKTIMEATERCVEELQKNPHAAILPSATTNTTNGGLSKPVSPSDESGGGGGGGATSSKIIYKRWRDRIASKAQIHEGGGNSSREIGGSVSGGASNINDQLTPASIIDLSVAVTSSLQSMHAALYSCLQDESYSERAAGAIQGEFLTKKTSRILGIWISYLDGFEQLSSVFTSPTDSDRELLFRCVPLWLLTEVIRYVYVPGLKASCTMPAKKISSMASEALLTVENNAVMRLQAIVNFVKKDDVFILSSIPSIALAAIDWTCSEFLREILTPLAEIFENTISEKSQANSIDGSVLNLCLNHYKVLSHLQTQVVNELEIPILELMKTQTQSPVYPRFAEGLGLKFRAEGTVQLQNEFKSFSIQSMGVVGFGITENRRIVLCRQTIKNLLEKARSLVVAACVAPIRNIIVGYGTNSAVWSQKKKSINTENSAANTIPGNVNDVTPSQQMVSVGEQLFSLVPMLEHSGLLEEWLQSSLNEAAVSIVSQVLQISALSPYGGFSQLMCDMDYVYNVVSALYANAKDEKSFALRILLSVLKDIDADSKEKDLETYFLRSDATLTGGELDELYAKYQATIRQMVKQYFANVEASKPPVPRTEDTTNSNMISAVVNQPGTQNVG